jgi:hypothetical protein
VVVDFVVGTPERLAGLLAVAMEPRGPAAGLVFSGGTSGPTAPSTTVQPAVRGWQPCDDGLARDTLAAALAYDADMRSRGVCLRPGRQCVLRSVHRRVHQCPHDPKANAAGRLADGSFALGASPPLGPRRERAGHSTAGAPFRAFGLSEFHQCRAESTYRGLQAHPVAPPGLHAQKCNPSAIVIGPLGGEFRVQLDRATRLLVSSSGPEESANRSRTSSRRRW